ncbi:radical SAM protein [Candidatus Hecatella orcuttiae]|uniref:radical SAM protein n=1 Tax=Candidatus Hecatella orcuttiae TaxID=1935119 RepID=UPI002867EA14|nr:radical SAM protein [Candidatus Hecatella orcuttiae]
MEPSTGPSPPRESPEYVRTSLAAAITLGLMPGRFYRNAKLYCLNLLLTYREGCAGRCAYCGLSHTRTIAKPWDEYSFIRVEWPVVLLEDVARRIESGFCSHVERVCVSMVTNGKAKNDTLKIVGVLSEKIEAVSALIAPTIVDKKWLGKLKHAGADKVGVAVDAATPELFERLRGKGVGGPHKWNKYWRVVEESVEVFGRFNVGIHLIVGLGETEEEAVKTIQKAYDAGALTHLFSFFPEENSQLQDSLQPPIGKYRRVQLARFLINKGLARVEDMTFDRVGRLTDFGIAEDLLNETVESGWPFMTSGCAGKSMDSACNRPFSNCTPYQAYLGELRNYPFQPNRDDVELIRRQLWDYSEEPVRVWMGEVAGELLNQRYRC